MVEDKTVFEEIFDCPCCDEQIIVRRKRKVVTEPVKGEYQLYSEAEKWIQETL